MEGPVPRSATLLIVLVLLAPAAARAKFQLRIESNSWFDETKRLTLAVFADPTDNEDEQLAGYDIGFVSCRSTARRTSAC